MNNEIIILAVSLLLLIVLFCKDLFVSKASFPAVSADTFFSKGQTDWLRGLSIILNYCWGGPIPEIIHIFGVTQFIICLCARMRGTSKILVFFGQHSLELYLAHSIYLNYIRKFFNLQESVLTYVLFMMSSVLIAYGVKKISSFLTNRFNKALIN